MPLFISRTLSLFKRKPKLNWYTVWFSFTVRGNTHDIGYTGEMPYLASNQFQVREWFGKANPGVNINMITEGIINK